jgi:predicted membrane protein
VGIYLIIIGIGQIITSGFTLGVPLVVGALTLLFGIIVMVNPGVLNALVAIIFIIQGIFMLAQYYHWF